MSEKKEEKKKDSAAEAKPPEEAKSSDPAEAKEPVRQGEDKKPVERQPDEPAKKPKSVRVYRTRDGRRFYGEDWNGKGTFIDKDSGKEIETFDREVKQKVPDPDNPNRMIPKTIFVKDHRLKGEKD